MTPAHDNHSREDQFADQLSAWQSSPLLAHPYNGDLTQRVVSDAADAHWQPCPIPNIEVRLLEYRLGSNPRFTALMRLTPDTPAIPLGFWRKLETLVLNGSLTMSNVEATDMQATDMQATDIMAPGGNYVRLPGLNHTLSLNNGEEHWPLNGHLYVAFAGGHYPDGDLEPRSIDTTVTDAWLPGPAEGIEVLPLHVHGSANAMLLRWTNSAAFQPQLDPKGEEILVLSGALADERGRYTAGTWIRNPEISWQHWSGTQGTVVFYKSGHFRANERTSDLANESTNG